MHLQFFLTLLFSYFRGSYKDRDTLSLSYIFTSSTNKKTYHVILTKMVHKLRRFLNNLALPFLHVVSS